MSVSFGRTRGGKASSERRGSQARMSKQRVFGTECEPPGCAPGCHLPSSRDPLLTTYLKHILYNLLIHIYIYIYTSTHLLQSPFTYIFLALDTLMGFAPAPRGYCYFLDDSIQRWIKRVTQFVNFNFVFLQDIYCNLNIFEVEKKTLRKLKR